MRITIEQASWWDLEFLWPPIAKKGKRNLCKSNSMFQEKCRGALVLM
jgi:hypothetical protein